MHGLCRMNKYIIQGLLWLYIFSTGLFVVSLEPGYLDFDNLPDTNFSCVGKVIGGYYADLETNCQMFHVCTIGQLDEPMDIRFLCLNGTVFDQETRVCERIDEVDCSKSEKFYSLNLELYGNTAPPILEENPETESPIIEKAVSSTTTTTTTSTTARPVTSTTSRTEYFTSSSRPVSPSPYHRGPSSHHFSLEQPPNYTPEEINISLNPGAPPNIRTKVFEFPQNSPYSDNVDNSNKKTVTTTSSVFKISNNYQNSVDNSRFSSSTTESERNSFNPSLQTPQSVRNNFKYNFNYHDTRPRDFNPSRTNNYQYHHNFANFRPPVLSSSSYQNNPYRSSTQRNEYLPSRKNFEVSHPSSTSRNYFLQPIKSQSQQYFRTEKPEGDQLPVPVLPTISPIVFSSPAPFALNRHVETKRYTDEHELPPRIIISASASVSDASGRTLNYSLGTIGAAKILAQPPASYDDYKEEDVVLDPFYHDVPKVPNNGKRTKRDTSGNGKGSGQSNVSAENSPSSTFKRSKRRSQNINPTDIIKNEEEAVEVLKFLFDWYKRQEKSTKSPINIPVNPELISNINEEFSHRSYVPEDYEDERTDTLEKSISPVSDQQIIDAPKTSHGNSFLQQASRGPSSKMNSGKKVAFDIRNYPIPTNYEEEYEEKTGTYFSPRTPPDQYLEKSSDHNSKAKSRPNRGRHRFTFPYATTPSQNNQERLIDNHFGERKRAQNPSLPNYEESYEQDTKNTDNYKVNQDSRNEASYFGREYDQNSDLNLQYNTDAPVVTTQKPLSQRIDEVQEPRREFITERSIDGVEITIGGTTQDHPQSATYAPTTSKYSFEDQSITTDDSLDSSYAPENTIQPVTKSPEYTFYENDVDINNGESQRSTTTKFPQETTEPYRFIDTYEYTDDNYEPAIFNHGHEKEQSEKNNVIGGIHEETLVNIDLTETPQEALNESGNPLLSSEETASKNNIRAVNPDLASQEEINEGSTAEEVAYPVNGKEFVFIDKNVTSFGDILNSLRKFQKYEQDLYNYQNNLTEIKDYEAENTLTTQSEETTTSSSSSFWETTTNDSAYTHNSEENKSEIAKVYTNSPINTTEEQYQEKNIFGETEEGSASSTRYIAVTTESYETTDEPQLFTSKPINFEATTNVKFGTPRESTKYEIAKTESTAVSIEHTTYPQNDSTKEVNKDILSTTPSDNIRDGITESITHHLAETDNVSLETTPKVHEDPTEPTTASSFSDEIVEKELVASGPKTRYRGRNRSRQRPYDSSRKRVENTPVSNSYTESTGNRRNSRRRQQNKPFYNLEHLTEVQLVTSTTPSTSKSDDLKISEISTISNSATEKVVNIQKFIRDDINAKTSYETVPFTNVFYSNPKGFYVTKTKEESKYRQEYTSPITSSIPLSTEQNIEFDPTEETVIPQSTQQTIVPESTEYYPNPPINRDFSVADSISTVSETTENVFTRNEYTNAIRTDHESIFEKNTQATDRFDTLSTESSSEASTNLTEQYTTRFIDSTNAISARTEEDTPQMPQITTDISTVAGTNDTTGNTFETTIVSTTFAYSTLNMDETESTTNNSVTTLSSETPNFNINNFDHLKNIEESLVSTESIETDSTFINEELTTEDQTENINSKEEEFINHTTEAYVHTEIETVTSNAQETTRNPSTKIDIITEVNSSQYSTDHRQNNLKRQDKNSFKSSSENEIDNDQNKLDTPNNRDGRKYDKRKQNRQNASGNRFSSRHRFSSTSVTPRTFASRRPSNSYKHRFSSTPDIIQTTSPTSTELNVPESKTPNVSEKLEDAEMLTEVTLPKNVKPTLATLKSKDFTTPMLYKVELRKEKVNKHFVFNCFGKPLNQFYSDPRDCRLFHYCTNGYSKNQLLDMKFVCDLGTHFDDEKLLCTREIPKRCL